MGYWVRFRENGSPDWFGVDPIPGAEWLDVDRETLISKRRVKGQWVDRDPEPDAPPSQEAVEAENAAAREAEAARKKAEGVEFDGVMCSATKDDQDGLAAVLLSIQLQGAAFKPTIFHFANGSKLVISLDNYQAFAAVWMPFRQSFFAVK